MKKITGKILDVLAFPVAIWIVIHKRAERQAAKMANWINTP